MKIRFNSLIDMVNFSKFAEENLVNSDINITHGNICVDAKSIIGVVSLDISKEYNIEIISQDEQEKDKIIRYLEQFNALKK